MFTYIHTLIISSISHKNFNLKISSIWSYCYSAFLHLLLTIQPGNIFEIFFMQKLSFLLRFNILMTLGLTLGFLGTFLPKVIKSWLSWPTSSQNFFLSHKSHDFMTFMIFFHFLLKSKISHLWSWYSWFYDFYDQNKKCNHIILL